MVPLAAQSQGAQFASVRDPHGTVYTGGSGGAFVARDGGWRVQLGTEATDNVRALAVAPDGSIYAAGTMGAGGFVAKLNSQGVPGAWLKLETPLQALAIDTDGSVYVGGDGVLAKLSPSLTVEDRFGTRDVTALAARRGTVWVAFRYFPGYMRPNMQLVDLGAGTRVEAMTVDPNGSIYAAGTTTAPDLPNARNHLNGPSDAFVARLDTATGGVEWSQYVGGYRERRRERCCERDQYGDGVGCRRLQLEQQHVERCDHDQPYSQRRVPGERDAKRVCAESGDGSLVGHPDGQEYGYDADQWADSGGTYKPVVQCGYDELYGHV